MLKNVLENTCEQKKKLLEHDINLICNLYKNKEDLGSYRCYIIYT